MGKVTRTPLRAYEFTQYLRPHNSPSAELTNVAHEGWLTKSSGSRIGKWERRFFVLAGGVLYYFKDSEKHDEIEMRGKLPVNYFEQVWEKRGRDCWFSWYRIHIF
jgi:guanine nucleotide exchange factor for Rho/Rac/Cdc42-like GTPase family protein